MLLPSADRGPYADANGITATHCQQAEQRRILPGPGNLWYILTLFDDQNGSDIYIVQGPRKFTRRKVTALIIC